MIVDQVMHVLPACLVSDETTEMVIKYRKEGEINVRLCWKEGRKLHRHLLVHC